MDPWNFLYLGVYIAAGTSQSLLVKASIKDGILPYEPAFVALLVEFCKLIIAAVVFIFIETNDVSTLPTLTLRVREVAKRWKSFRLFAIPAGLYAVFNVLNFYNLQLVSPGTFRLLVNVKVLFSGLLLQAIFAIRLSGRQWLALLLLILACIIEQYESFNWHTGILALFSIGIQAFCSSLAGVYFQFLLQTQNQPQTLPHSHSQGHGQQSAATTGLIQPVSLWEKNMYLYCWGCVFNIIYLYFFRGDIFMNFFATIENFDSGVAPIIIASILGGFSTSLILRYMDVIIKEYGNFMEMCAIVLGANIFFGTPIRLTLLIAVVVVSCSLYMYNVTPESPPSSSSSSKSNTSTPLTTPSSSAPSLSSSSSSSSSSSLSPSSSSPSSSSSSSSSVPLMEIVSHTDTDEEGAP